MNEAQRKEVLKFLQRNKVAVLATISPEGEPQPATVTHLMDNDFTFYCVAKSDSRKVRNIKKNPRVGIVVGTDPNVPITVQMQGNATIISNPNHYIITHLKNKMNPEEAQWLPLLKSPKGDHEFIKVDIDWMRLLNLDGAGYSETANQDFQQIIP